MTGSGTLLDPYVIWDVNDLQNVNLDLTAYYELGIDIDATATIGWNAGAGFIPIAQVGSFSGHFDGMGFSITNLFINRPGTNSQALFDDIQGGTVQNVTLITPNITGQNFVAGIASNPDGATLNTYTLTNCVVSGGTITGTSYVGGIVGETFTGTITDCNCSAAISGFNYVGGVGGQITGGTFDNCYATGDVTATDDNAGGFAGRIRSWNSVITISNCHAEGAVLGIDNIGGFVGRIQTSGFNIDISDSYATGSVTGDDDVGGFSGYASDGGGVGTITSCYATGNVIAGDDWAGGFISSVEAFTISDCYATGDVQGDAYVGGFTGEMYTGAAIDTSYATGAVTFSGDDGGGFIGNADDGTISECYATGDVVATAGLYPGGFLGAINVATIENCYARGSVTGNTCGGFGAHLQAGATLNNCYSTGLVAGVNAGGFNGDDTGIAEAGNFWDVDTSGTLLANDVGTGENTPDMKIAATFTGAGWDFALIWSIDPALNDGYPSLRNNLPPAPPILAPTVTTLPATAIT